MKQSKKVPQEVIDLRSCIIGMAVENFTTSFGEYINLLSTLSSKKFVKSLHQCDKSGALNTLILDAKNHIGPIVKQPPQAGNLRVLQPLPFDGSQFPKFMVTLNHLNSILYPSTFKFMKNIVFYANRKIYWNL